METKTLVPVGLQGNSIGLTRLAPAVCSSRIPKGPMPVALPKLDGLGRLVGRSPSMLRVYDMIALVAPTSSSALLLGETGTGKDLIAETIHGLSTRSSKPFVAVNCGAINPTLIESELFGHESGSFTGASKRRKGVFEQAEGGTLFLDEITEMPLDMQVKLLRVLESREITRVGAEESRAVDFRLIAATNRSPEGAIAQGKLRADLFYRLQVFPIVIPPLRDRQGDVELLAQAFLREFSERAGTTKELAASALDELAAYEWPGNVRELRNVIERACVLAGRHVHAEHVVIHPGSAQQVANGTGVHIEVGTSIAAAEKALILATLDYHQGDKQQAAETLGICLKTLYNRLNGYGLGRRTLSRVMTIVGNDQGLKNAL